MEFKQKEINEEEQINKLFQISLNEALETTSKKNKYKIINPIDNRIKNKLSEHMSECF
jgi:hypothetical protein